VYALFFLFPDSNTDAIAFVQKNLKLIFHHGRAGGGKGVKGAGAGSDAVTNGTGDTDGGAGQTVGGGVQIMRAG